MKQTIAIIALLTSIGAITHAEPTIVVDPINKTIQVVDNTEEETNADSVTSTGDVLTGTQNTDGITEEEDNTTPTQTTPTSSLSEFDQALAWMYANGLTKYDIADDYKPFDLITREQFAKMVSQFYTTMNYDTETKNTACNFTDIANADASLVPHIQETCRLGIFRGYGDGTFKPFQNITRAEVLTVLLRIYNQKKLDESTSPRWKNYYDQAKELEVTTETVAANMDKTANRYLVAIYIWRLRNVIKGIDTTTDNTTTDNTNTPTNNNQNLQDTITSIGKDLNIDQDAQLKEAIHHMYEDGMIDFDQAYEQNLYQYITREDVARIVDIFGQQYISTYTPTNTDSLCNNLKDITNTDSQTHITNVCSQSLMRGDGSGNFYPDQEITKAQFVTAVVRLIDGKQDETTTPRRENYYKKAQERNIISYQDKLSFERKMTYIEVILFMHKLKINALLSQDRPDIAISNEFVRVIESNDETKAYIDSNFLRNLDNKVGYIILDDEQRYKVIRDHIEEYGNNHITRYGNIVDTSTEDEVGSAWFLSQKGRVIDGIIRLVDDEEHYHITPDTDSYYWYIIDKKARP